MDNFTHLIITRFNLRYPGIQPSADWLEHRFNLFRQFCYPSVRAQTNQNFRWLVLFDSETPANYREQINALCDWPNFQPCFIEEYRLAVFLDSFVRPNLAPHATHLISTTLDNDDALARDFVQTVQTYFAQQTFQFLNFANGLRLDLQTNRLYSCSVKCNPFITLVENIEGGEMKTMLGALPHSLILERFGNVVEEIDIAPIWLQVVHGRNLAPTGRWGRQRQPITQLALFELGYTPPQIDEPAWQITVDRWRGSAERLIIDHIPDNVRRIVIEKFYKRTV